MDKKTQIQKALQSAMDDEVRSLVRIVKTNNDRSYVCEIPECGRPGYSKGLCNMHYMRNRLGTEMLAAGRTHSLGEPCIECGEPLNKKGGWRRCAKHFKRRRHTVLKAAAIKQLGGKCFVCHGVFPARVFDFHHTGSKNNAPSYLLSNASFEKIAQELVDCVLLCANCHRLEHNDTEALIFSVA